MRLFGRRKEEEQEPVPQVPRLAGWDEPHYSHTAKEAFLDVLMKVSEACRPPSKGEGLTDSAVELDRAMDVATLFCNGELLDRMRALRNAAIEESMGGSREKTRAAQKHFTDGCRQALGTND